MKGVREVENEGKGRIKMRSEEGKEGEWLM